MSQPNHEPIDQLLLRHRPKIARLLETEPRTDCVQISAQNGLLTCHATGNRLIDGPTLWESIDAKMLHVADSNDPIIVCPAGFGGLFQKLRERADTELRWFLIEPLAEMFRASLVSEPWWPEVLRDERVKLFVGRGAMQAFFDWAQRHAILFSGEPALVAGRRPVPGEDQTLVRFTEKVRELVAASRRAYTTAREALDRHYEEPRKRDRVLLVEPDHAYLAPAIVGGIEETGYEGILSGGGRRLADVMGCNKEFVYVNDHRPDLVLLLHHNPLPPGTGDLLREYDIPAILWYLDHPRVVRRIAGDPGLYQTTYVFDKNYIGLLREFGHSQVATLPIGACLPLCSDECEGPVEIKYPVTFLGGAVGGQYLSLRQNRVGLAETLDDFIESAVSTPPPDQWVIENDLLLRLPGVKEESSSEALMVVLQGVSYKRRLRYLAAAAPQGLHLFGRQWDDSSLCGELTEHSTGGPIPYGNELAELYRSSAINLNILDAMMVDSINLRSFDVMASGGFLLSEYRPEYERTFALGEEMDCFRTPEELVEKIEFYLAHPEIRTEIAGRGQRKVLGEHTITQRMRDLLSAELPETEPKD